MLYRAFIRIYNRVSRTRYYRVFLYFYLAVNVTLGLYLHHAFRTRRNYATSYDVTSLFSNNVSACQGHFIGYGHEFVWLRYASVDTVSEVFTIPCKSKVPRYWFYQGPEGTPYEQWIINIDYSRRIPHDVDLHTNKRTTFVVKRKESNNHYHTMCEFFNIFLLIRQYKLDAKELDILLIDTKKKSPMDPIWATLFHKIRRSHDVHVDEVFEHLVWIPIGYESPINFHQVKTVQYIEEFRSFFLNSFQVKESVLDCKNLTIAIILRRDYYLPHGEFIIAQRKFLNEIEIVEAIKQRFKKHRVHAITLESMSVKEQIELISSTDILIGMHGAGLTHVLFLPQRACVLELFPASYYGRSFDYFKAFSRWRNIYYTSWINMNKNDEDETSSSKMPADVILKETEKLYKHIQIEQCS